MGSGEGTKDVVTPVKPGYDGRYVRQYGIKATINGTYPLRVRGYDTAGNFGEMTCTPGITVTF